MRHQNGQQDQLVGGEVLLTFGSHTQIYIDQLTSCKLKLDSSIAVNHF